MEFTTMDYYRQVQVDHSSYYFGDWVMRKMKENSSFAETIGYCQEAEEFEIRLGNNGNRIPGQIMTVNCHDGKATISYDGESWEIAIDGYPQPLSHFCFAGGICLFFLGRQVDIPTRSVAFITEKAPMEGPWLRLVTNEIVRSALAIYLLCQAWCLFGMKMAAGSETLSLLGWGNYCSQANYLSLAAAILVLLIGEFVPMTLRIFISPRLYVEGTLTGCPRMLCNYFDATNYLEHGGQRFGLASHLKFAPTILGHKNPIPM